MSEEQSHTRNKLWKYTKDGNEGTLPFLQENRENTNNIWDLKRTKTTHGLDDHTMADTWHDKFPVVIVACKVMCLVPWRLPKQADPRKWMSSITESVYIIQCIHLLVSWEHLDFVVFRNDFQKLRNKNKSLIPVQKLRQEFLLACVTSLLYNRRADFYSLPVFIALLKRLREVLRKWLSSLDHQGTSFRS